MMESKLVKFVSDLIETVEHFDKRHPIDVPSNGPAYDDYYIREVPVFSDSGTKVGTVKFIEDKWAWVPFEEDDDW